MKKKKGFTLIELLVVIAIIAMLLAILMPALGKVKKLAMRLVCGTNLKGMGTAVNVYAFDYDDSYPVAGGGGLNTWAPAEMVGGEMSSVTDDWDDPSKNWRDDDNVSVGASLFLLIREADVGTKSFICKSSDQQPFTNTTDYDIVELWDFGGANDLEDQSPAKCQSYSYQVPYNTGTNFPADGTSPASAAIMADRNPWQDTKLTEASLGSVTSTDFISMVSLINWVEGAPKYEVQAGNAEAHDREGQNVLFNDGHVEFTKRPDIGTQDDNIYTPFIGPNNWDENARRTGEQKTIIGTLRAKSSEDSVLVGDSERQ